MAIRTVVTRGFGNGTFNGTIALLVVRGYKTGVLTVAFTGSSGLGILDKTQTKWRRRQQTWQARQATWRKRR